VSFSSGFPLQAPPPLSLPDRHTASQITRASSVVAQRSYDSQRCVEAVLRSRATASPIPEAERYLQSYSRCKLLRDRLRPEEQSRFDSQYLRAQEKAKAIAERHEDLSNIPIGMPDAVPKKTWRKKKDHGKANARGLTAAEASDKDRQERERLAKRAGKARATSEDVAEEDDDGIYTWDSLTPRVGESQGGTTITVAPKTAMLPPPPLERSPSLSLVPADLPPSTAPARLPEPGQKRKRVFPSQSG
jgi:hypothetical protein